MEVEVSKLDCTYRDKDKGASPKKKLQKSRQMSNQT